MRSSAYIFLGVSIVATMVSPKMLFAEALKLPYQAGESFVVTQGYDSPPTHIKKDFYATDWSQAGCDAYGKPVVAARAGKVILAETADRDTGYGLQVLVDHGEDRVTRYAHLERDSIIVASGDFVAQGDAIGRVGDTGYVVGAGCPDHPGTHLHFALYSVNADGTYGAVKPEPISGYMNITEGQWYLSDNAVDSVSLRAAADAANTDDISPQPMQGVVLGARTSVPVGPLTPAENSSSLAGASSSVGLVLQAMPTSSSQSGGLPPPAGGVTATILSENVSAGGGDNAAATDSSAPSLTDVTTHATSSSLSDLSDESSTPSSTVSEAPSSTWPSLFALDPPSPLINATSIAVFDSSTLAIDFAWQAPVNASGVLTYEIFDLGMTSNATSGFVPIWTGTSTLFSYPSLSDGAERHFGIQATDDKGHTSSVMFASVQTPHWMSVVQSYDGDVSYPSWYSDTWYNLGTGFYGTVRSLTLNGFINNPDYFATHVWLDEFLDASCTVRNQTFALSDAAPFTATSTLVVMDNLHVPLQPNKYYRLNTYQDYQNRSVILRGSAATGTAMWNGWANGIGRMENYYPFYPYLAWTFVPNWPPLLPPQPPAGLLVTFDAANSMVDISWSPTTDLDTTSSLLTYEYAVSTSSAFSDSDWHPVGAGLSARVPVIFPNHYEIAVRAVDDLGNISIPDGLSWSFPPDYFPLPSQLGHDGGADVAMKFHLAEPVSLTGVALWTSVVQWGIYRASDSMVWLYADTSGTLGTLIAVTDPAEALDPAPGSEIWHSFASPVPLAAGDYWIVAGHAPGPSNSPSIYGSNNQLYFRLQATY